MMSPHNIPTPGSDEALAIGCGCAVLDNAHGRGYRGIPGVFVVTESCPLHGSQAIETGAGQSREGEKP